MSRLTDDQSQAKIRKEAESIERVLARVRLGSVDMVSSEALEDEARRIPSLKRRLEVENFLTLASITVEIDDAVARRAHGLVALGYGPLDALHIAAAESAHVDALPNHR